MVRYMLISYRNNRLWVMTCAQILILANKATEQLSTYILPELVVSSCIPMKHQPKFKIAIHMDGTNPAPPKRMVETL